MKSLTLDKGAIVTYSVLSADIRLRPRGRWGSTRKARKMSTGEASFLFIAAFAVVLGLISTTYFIF